MAIDPRRRFPFGQMAPMLYGAGTLNNAAPSFQGPAYYNQMFNRPLQDWSQFMPTNSPLAGGGGSLYQTPWWGYGSGGGSGWGGGYGGMPGGGLMGGGMMGGYPGWGGGYPGYTQPGFGGYRPPQFGGGTTPGFSPGPIGSTQPTTPGRHHPEMYDADGNYVGAEGGGAREANWEGGGTGGGGAGGVPWQDTFMAPLGHRLGWNFAGYNPGQGQDTGSSYADMEDTDEGFMLDALSGPPVRGLLDDPVGNAQFPDDPMALPSYQGPVDMGLLAGQRIARQNAMSRLTGDPDFAAAADAQATRNVDDFVGMPQINAPSIEQQKMGMAAPIGTPTRPAAPVAMPVGVHPGIPSTVPTPVLDDFSGMKQAQMKASTAAAKQRYLNSVDDEARRAMRNMSAAQIEREIYGRDAEAQAAAEAGLGERNIEINRQGGWDSEVG